MNNQNKKIVGISAALLFLLILMPSKKLQAASAAALFTSIAGPLSNFLKTWEGFSATPYWDKKQWSWGYGTRVPGSVNDPNVKPAGTITREQAFQQMQAHFIDDLAYLAPLLTINLTPNQWTAYLSFSYNLGPGNADNLLPNINGQNRDALGVQWNKYIYAGGVIDPDLVARRKAEWQLWNTV